MSDRQPIHATLVARCAGGAWQGALLRGSSGAGKSTLALALIGRGWRLAADDQVIVWRSGGRAWGRAPRVLWGLLEVRGVGVLPCPALDYVEIIWVIDASDAEGGIERTPPPTTTRLCGVDLPACTLTLSAPGAAERVAAFCGALRV